MLDYTIFRVRHNVMMSNSGSVSHRTVTEELPKNNLWKGNTYTIHRNQNNYNMYTIYRVMNQA